MASFLEDLWTSIFTPGPTPTLIVATNASFAALQALLLVLLIATYSIHFVVLSLLCGGLWWSINWFVSELRAAKAQEQDQDKSKDKVPEGEKVPIGDSDTETEVATAAAAEIKPPTTALDSSTFLKPKLPGARDAVRERRSLAESSGDISTDSEWEKVSEGDGKDR